MRRFAYVISLVTIVFAVSNLSAQQTSTSTVPNLITYSGTLLQSRSVPIPSRTVGVTFAIYKQQEGGAPVWMETQNVSVDGSGHFSVLLGSTRAEGIATDLFSAQEERWLGVKAEGKPEQSRVMLVSVPYAFKAHEAETLGGMPASAFALASQSTEANAVSAEIAASLATQNSSVRTGAARGHGTQGYIPIWRNSLYLGNSELFQDVNKNIGIGTTTPQAKFDVSGPINAASYEISGQPAVRMPFSSTFVGWFAGSSNSTSSVNNVFVGYGAGWINDTGHDNVFTGWTAGANNTTGFGNVFVGAQAGTSNTTGGGNVFNGRFAGNANTTGVSNTFIGGSAGVSNVTGRANVFNGGAAGASNVAGSFNVFNGSTAGYNNTADNNVFTGYGAGFNNTIGSGNVFEGSSAGVANTTGAGNTILGSHAGLAVVAGNNNIVIGENSGPANDESGTIRIGNSDQTATYIAGISSAATNGGRPVFVDSTGKLGTGGGTLNHIRQTLQATNSTSQVIVQWNKAFPDTNYTVTCSPQAAVPGDLWEFGIAGVGANSVLIELTSYSTQTITVHCIGIHD